MALKPAAAASALAVVLLVCAAVLYTHDVAFEADEAVTGRFAPGDDAQVRNPDGNVGNTHWGAHHGRRLAADGPPRDHGMRGERGGKPGRERDFTGKRAELLLQMEPMTTACTEEAKALPCPLFHAVLAESSDTGTPLDASLARSWDKPPRGGVSMPVPLALAICLEEHEEKLSNKCKAALGDAPLPSRTVISVLSKCLPTAPAACRTHYGRTWYADAVEGAPTPDADASAGAQPGGDGGTAARVLQESEGKGQDEVAGGVPTFTLDDALKVVDVGDAGDNNRESEDGDGDGDEGGERQHRGKRGRKGKKWHKRQSGGKERHREGRHRRRGKHGKRGQRMKKWQNEALNSWRDGAEEAAGPGGATQARPTRGLEPTEGLEWVPVGTVQDKTVDGAAPAAPEPEQVDAAAETREHDGGDGDYTGDEDEDESGHETRRRHRGKHGNRRRHGKHGGKHRRGGKHGGHKSRRLLSKAHKPMLAGPPPTVRVGPVDGHEGGPQLGHSRPDDGASASPPRPFMPEARGGGHGDRGDGSRRHKFTGRGSRRGGKGRGGGGKGRGGGGKGRGGGGDHRGPYNAGLGPNAEPHGDRDGRQPGTQPQSEQQRGDERRGWFDRSSRAKGGKGFKPSKFIKCLRKHTEELAPTCKAAVEAMPKKWKKELSRTTRHMEERPRFPRGGDERNLVRGHGHKQATAPHARHGSRNHRRPARKMMQPAVIAGLVAGAALVILGVVVTAVCIRRSRRAAGQTRNGFTQMQPVRASASSGPPSPQPSPPPGVSRRAGAAGATPRSSGDGSSKATAHTTASQVDPLSTAGLVDAQVVATPV